MTARTRVLLADDHPLYRAGLAGLLATTDDLRVVAQAADGHEAVVLAAQTHPDVVVLDVAMPELNGVAAARQILAADPDIAVLMVTMLDGDDLVFEAMKAGAKGYVVKSADPRAVLTAIRTVAEGGAVLSSELTARLTAWFTTLQERHGPLSHLTPREKATLRLLAHGLDNAAVAEALGVSPKTARNLVSTVLAKLHARDRSAAGAIAREAGLI